MLKQYQKIGSENLLKSPGLRKTTLLLGRHMLGETYDYHDSGTALPCHLTTRFVPKSFDI